MIPRRLLFVLTTVVLALHALLLSGASASALRPTASAPPVFVTRTVNAPAALSPVAAPVVRAAPKRAKPSAKPPSVPRTQTPVPAASPTDLAEGAPAAAPSVLASPPWLAPSQSELLALDASGENEAQPLATAHAAETPVRAASAPEQESPPPTAGDNPPPVKLPPPARLSFEVTGKARGFGYNAQAELLWQHDATSYSAHQEVKVIFLGSRSQSSVGSVTERGLQPRRFGDRSRSERAAHFDFSKGQVTFSANTPAAPIEPGAQDRLSVFLQLASMLAAAPEHYPAGTRIAMTTVSARAADVWTFTVEGEEALELPIGTMRTVQLQRLPRRDYDQKAQVWLAPELGYLPARIRITEANGDFVELNLSGHEAP